MLIISHRGVCARNPENTLEAFQAAIALGVDGIETDVRLSADRLPVLCHDRITPDGREVSRLTRDELAEALGHPVPTLDEALDIWASGLWNVEIKTPAAAEATHEVLREYAGSHNILITSFWHNLVETTGQDRRLRYGALLANRPADHESLNAMLDRLPSLSCVVWDYEVLDSALLGQLLDRGIKSLCYGVKTKEEHAACWTLPLSGVITDHPDFLLSYGSLR